MCYWKKLGEKPLKATEDITVFKVVRSHTITNKGFMSRYQNFTYKFGVTEKLVLNEIPYTSRINIGFHSYKTVEYGKNLMNGKNTVKAKKRCLSNYSGKVIRSRIGYTDAIIIECIIPKGSKYFFNDVDYVSDSIKPICLILPKDKILDKMSTEFKNVLNTHFNITTDKI